jgi:hypothetical protein
MRKRRWQVAYRCEYFKMNIIERMRFCKQPVSDKKCVGCVYKREEKC